MSVLQNKTVDFCDSVFFQKRKNPAFAYRKLKWINRSTYVTIKDFDSYPCSIELVGTVFMWSSFQA